MADFLLDIGDGGASLVGRSRQTKPRLTGPDVVTLVASGIPDIGVLSGVATSHKAFDVSPAPVLNVKQALVASR
jgi:hypothetical protein